MGASMRAILWLFLLSGAKAYKMPSSTRSRIASVAQLRGGSLSASTATSASTEQAKSGLGWDSHKAIDEIPASLVNSIEGNESMRRKFEALCRGAQNDICKAIEELDGTGKFREDAWVRESGGGGISRVMAGGKVFEKAGVNLSVVYGTMPQEALKAATERGVDRAAGMKPGERVPFFACGLSSVMHPKNPFAPTMHFNYRYFETDGGVWWFGGGTDITPSYLNVDDMKHFHGTYKAACDKHDAEFYPKFKKWADDYFRVRLHSLPPLLFPSPLPVPRTTSHQPHSPPPPFMQIPHRGETRGLGGIFFDDMNDRDPEKLLAFASEGLASVVPAYVPIVAKHKDDPFTDKQKEWQLMRRGRYVEFNLVYDRGTIFGLKTGGRIESILMSLPENARWEYDHKVEPGSKEEEIMKCFREPREWL